MHGRHAAGHAATRAPAPTPTNADAQSMCPAPEPEEAAVSNSTPQLTTAAPGLRHSSDGSAPICRCPGDTTAFARVLIVFTRRQGWWYTRGGLNQSQHLHKTQDTSAWQHHLVPACTYYTVCASSKTRCAALRGEEEQSQAKLPHSRDRAPRSNAGQKPASNRPVPLI